MARVEYPIHFVDTWSRSQIEESRENKLNYELLSLRHLNNDRTKSKFQGGSTSAMIWVAPACKYASNSEILTALGREIERSISFGFRPTWAHHWSRICILWATIGGSPKV